MSSKTNTTAPKEEAKPALVPKLRFPEFRGTEGWTEMPLKRAAQINPTNSGLPESFIYIDLESVEAGKLKAKNRISREGAPSRAQRLVERGDIIYQVVRPYQRNNLLCEFDDDEDYVASTGYAQLRAKSSNGFLYQSIHTDPFVGRVMAKCTGSNYPAINSSDLAEIQLPLPPTPAEQQKIAECLSSVDELMAAQARKVDALKTHKKGLMQQLFPREGETQPRLRFPEFRSAGEWEENSFGRVLKISSGKGFKASEYSKTGIRLLQIENVGYGSTKWSENTIYLPESYATEYPELVLRGGDIVLALNRPVTNDELKIAKIQEHEPIAILYQRVGRLEILDDSLQVDFAFHVCRQFIREFVVEKSIGSDQPFISLKDLYSQSLRLPGPAEQHRIATCLSSLDALITAETRKLEALKTHKKGLMQQLFPSPEEVAA